MEVKKQLDLKKLLILLLASSMLLAAVLYLPSGYSTINLVQTFGISSGAVAVIANTIDGGTTTSTVITIVGGLTTGGIGLIAAAGRGTFVAYLRSELQRRGGTAFVAW